MESVYLVNASLLLGSALVLVGIFSSLIATRFGAPMLLVFLVVGMLAGEDGPGGLVFDNYRLAYLIGSLALAIILFDGGLRTRLNNFRSVLAPSMVLATAGVVITASLMVVPSVYLLNLSWVEGFLLGSIVASTDAAAVFFLLKSSGLHLRHRVGALLEVESGTNDPIAVFLTLMMVQIVSMVAMHGGSTDGAAVQMVTIFVMQAVVGTVIGIGGGFSVSALLNRIHLPGGLHPLFVVAFAVFIFAVAALLQGSGFLAVYIAGLIVGNRPVRAFPSIVKFHDAVTWLCQILMFIVLGLLVSPKTLLEYGPPAICLALFLILVARPIMIWVCLHGFNYKTKEKMFVSWVGLRGAVSIFLSTLPVLVGLPHAEVYFNTAFFVVLVSLVLQGWSIPMVARRLGMGLPNIVPQVRRVELDLPGQLDMELVGYTIVEGSNFYRNRILPSWARPLMAVRDNTIVDIDNSTGFHAGDYAYFLAPPHQAHRLDRLFASDGDDTAPVQVGDTIFQTYAVLPDVLMKDLAEEYGFRVRSEEEDMSVQDVFDMHFLGRPATGDKITYDRAVMIVRNCAAGDITSADIVVETIQSQPNVSAARALFNRFVRP